jgi:hypothetical protein
MGDLVCRPRVRHLSDRVEQRRQALGRAQLLRAQAEFTGELTGDGQGGAGWHAGATFSIMLSEVT